MTKKIELEDYSNSELLEHFKDAVCDRNYNPSSEDYNKSGYSYSELQQEIQKRMDYGY
jgi:hypothetical protein